MSKTKYYVWSTKFEAGMVENDYEQCLSMYKGKPGGRNKKYNCKEEAEEALKNILENIEKENNADSQRTEEENVDLDSQSENGGEHTSVAPQISEITEDYLEEVAILKENQSVVNERFDQSITKIFEDQIELKKIIDFYSEKLNELRIDFDNRLVNESNLLRENFEKLINNQNKRIDKLESQLKVYEAKIERLEQQVDAESDSDEVESIEDSSRPLTDLETQNRYSALSDNQFTEKPGNQSNEKIQETESSKIEEPINKDNPPNQDRSYAKGSPILILTDSMMKGIIENKLSSSDYIRKEYIRGGTSEMLDFISNLYDETNYEKILIHTGTNDIFKKSLDEINKNISNLIEKCKLLWPDARIILSGIIYHKFSSTKNDLIDQINKHTKDLCKSPQNSNVEFMDNVWVTKTRDGAIDFNVFYDNLHLNNEVGLRKLAANVKKHLGLQRRQRQKMKRQEGRGQDNNTWKQQRNNFSTHFPFQRKIWRQANPTPYEEERIQWNNPQFQHKRGTASGLAEVIKPLITWLSTL